MIENRTEILHNTNRERMKKETLRQEQIKHRKPNLINDCF